MSKLAKTIEYLFYTFIFLLPWQTRWIWHYGQLGEGLSQYLTLSLYATEIILWLVFILALIYRQRLPDQELKWLNFKALNFYLLIVLFFIINVFSLLGATDQRLSFYYLLTFIQGFGLVLLIVNFKFNLKKIGWAFVLSGVGQSILALIQFFTQQVWASKWLGMAAQLPQTLGVAVIETNGQRWLRAYGALSHPNVLAGFLVICLVIGLILLLLAVTKKNQFILAGCLIIIFGGLIVTFSKAAFLALTIGLVFISIFIILSREKSLKILLGKIVLALVAVGALAIIFYPNLFWTRASSQGRLENKSWQERSLYVSQAKGLLEEYWLRGVGLGNYTLALYNQDDLKQAVWAYQPVHNVFLLLAVESGIIGFVIYILLLIECLHQLWNYKIDYHIQLLEVFAQFRLQHIYRFYLRRWLWLLGLSAIFLMILVLMFFDHYFWTQYFGLTLWWLMFGLWLKQISLLK